MALPARRATLSILLSVALSSVLGACAGNPRQAQAPEASPQPTAPSLPRRGIELGDLDRKQDPCVDFYEYANGAWRAANPIPPSMDRWSRRWASAEANKEQLKSILDEVSQRQDWPKASVEQLIGDYYASCTDEATIDRQGIAPIAPLLAEIRAIRTPAELQRMIIRLHEIAIRVPFGLSSSQDFHQPTRVIGEIFAGGLGLPDREYYFKPDSRFVETRKKYVAHIVKMFELAGESPMRAASASKLVFSLEKHLAAASLDKVAIRDPKNLDHLMDLASLRRIAPHFDWEGYFQAAGLSLSELNLDEPKFMRELDRQIARAPLAQWRAYLTWHVLRSAGPSLSAPFAEESFSFDEAYLNGVKEMKPRWKRCVESTDRWLGEALGRKYVEKYFPPEAKERAEEMVKNILLTMEDSLKALHWMTPETKQRALEKIATFHVEIGYPRKWKDYSSVQVSRASFWQNLAAARKFYIQDDLATIGKPVDRTRWGTTPPTSDAGYDPQLNEIVFPAGILEPPSFQQNAIDAVNYGAIGVAMGHEISHGFDDQGAKFDSEGRFNNWWSEQDLREFQKRGECIADQFDSYFIEPGIHHIGKLVLGESIADFAGVQLAWRAFKKSRGGQVSEPIVDGFTPAQQFFIAWGQVRGDSIRPETQRRMIQVDPHPVAKYRVIGPLSNMPDFAQAFRCRADAPIVRPPALRCDIW